jgi:hypothetical protein
MHHQKVANAGAIMICLVLLAVGRRGPEDLDPSSMARQPPCPFSLLRDASSMKVSVTFDQSCGPGASGKGRRAASMEGKKANIGWLHMI